VAATTSLPHRRGYQDPPAPHRSHRLHHAHHGHRLLPHPALIPEDRHRPPDL